MSTVGVLFMQQPPIIKYNLKDRGRKFSGKERNFNIPAIVAAINSPKCQERVSTRGMLGYFGHWPRIRFGLEPPEGGIADGKAHSIEPALVTTYLKAYPDGTIEHKTEFLDNDSGRMASRMYANRVGGFSTAIDANKPELFGFDWVNDPNYSTNRGYELVLDSVSGGEIDIAEILMAEQLEIIEAQRLLISQMDNNVIMALDAAGRLEQENNELLDLLSKTNTKKSVASAIFDSAAAGVASAHLDRINRDAAMFKNANSLPRFMETDNKQLALDSAADNEYLRIVSRVIPYV